MPSRAIRLQHLRLGPRCPITNIHINPYTTGCGWTTHRSNVAFQCDSATKLPIGHWNRGDGAVLPHPRIAISHPDLHFANLRRATVRYANENCIAGQGCHVSVRLHVIVRVCKLLLIRPRRACAHIRVNQRMVAADITAMLRYDRGIAIDIDRLSIKLAIVDSSMT